MNNHVTMFLQAPALATYALLPVVNKFTSVAGIRVDTSDISVAARILAHFPESLKQDQRVPDNLAALGELCKTPDANIIKLPNISASVPQLNAAITELRGKGYNVPLYPQNPSTEAEKKIKDIYSKVLGSAVNPVLREGNSDRRVAAPVKEYARKHPHKMGAWSGGCKSHVSYMIEGDFYGSEQSVIVPQATNVKIELVDANGKVTVLKASTKLQSNEIIDASVMNVGKLRDFYEREMNDCKAKGLLLSLHLKATMMKVSDPIIFGHAVNTYFKDVLAKYKGTFDKLKINTRNGFGDIVEKIKKLPESERSDIEADIERQFLSRPQLAYVNSDKGITNLHVPSDVIVDASMPVVVRDSGKMWNKSNKLQDTKCLIPDRCYAPMYNEVLNFCRENGQFDVTTMGSCSNVGLMAQKAEEYGSHDKTFEIPEAGTVRVVDAKGSVLMEHKVQAGDIWRMCQTKDLPIRDWVKLAVDRARATGDPAIFWLDNNRAHDRNLITKVNEYLKEHSTTGLYISIKDPVSAVRETMVRAKDGNNTISVTGNVLRDYLTDLFPILELGTSAKMLSIVPLLAGGGLFETGAGGSAPKHVEQFLKEGHLRWDSLGEYLALAVSLEFLAEKTNNARAKVLAETLNEATGQLLERGRSPSRKVYEIDNRASTFYLTLYWAKALAKVDPTFKDLAKRLTENRKQIVEELKSCQGNAVDIGGYYYYDKTKVAKAMRPSPTLNAIIDS